MIKDNRNLVPHYSWGEPVTRSSHADVARYVEDVMALKRAHPCVVCGSLGIYPIIDQNGTERYCIECPECHGSGIAPDAEA